jgi:hypothetical protein
VISGDNFCEQSTLDDSDHTPPDLTELQTDGLRQILITETEVEDILKILDTSKATGPDCINPRLVRSGGVWSLSSSVDCSQKNLLNNSDFSMSSTTRLPLCSIGGIVRLHSLFPVKRLTKVHQFLLPAFKLPNSEQSYKGKVQTQGNNRVITVRKDNPPWLTSSIKRVIRRKNRLHNRAKRSNLPGHWERYIIAYE